MKRIIAVLLALVMLLAACGAKPVETTQEPEDTEPAVDDGIPTLVWYQVGDGQPENYRSWKETVNAYLVEKLGIRLDVRVGEFGDWERIRAEVLRSGTPFDLMFTDMTTFTADVGMGAFADLTGLVELAPGLTELIPQAYLDSCRIGGRLYGIPCYKDSSMTNFFVWTKDAVQAGFPGYAGAHTLADIDQGLRAVAAVTGEPPLYLNQDGLSYILSGRYDACTLGGIGIGIAYRGGTEFVPVFEQADVLADLALLQGWMHDGLINTDAAIRTEANGTSALGVAQGWPSAAKGWSAGRGQEVLVAQYGETVVSDDTVLGSITCISAQSQHKAEAMKLLELVNTDRVLRDMLWYGEEGVNFRYVEEDGVRKVEKLNSGWTMAAYTQGTFFVATPEVGSDGYGEVQAQNEQAVPSPAFGFIPDTRDIRGQIEAVKAVYEEYRALILTGTCGQNEIDAMMEKMRWAGFDTILEEVNTQYAAWLAEN